MDNIIGSSVDKDKAKAEIRMYCCANDTTLPDKDNLIIDQYFHEISDVYHNFVIIAKVACHYCMPLCPRTMYRIHQPSF